MSMEFGLAVCAALCATVLAGIVVASVGFSAASIPVGWVW
jgi:uncharacterized protein (UPF0333 family)